MFYKIQTINIIVNITEHCSNCPFILSGSSDASSKRQILFSIDCSSLKTLVTRVGKSPGD